MKKYHSKKNLPLEFSKNNLFLGFLAFIVVFWITVLYLLGRQSETTTFNTYESSEQDYWIQNQEDTSMIELDDEGEEIEISDTTQIFYFTTPEWSSVSLDNFSDMYLLGSPFTLLGNVPENWFVNDSFTVEVKNQSWSLISSTTAQEEISENSDFNFILNLEFEVPDPSVSETGFIKFASSEAESKDFLELPIMFQ